MDHSGGGGKGRGAVGGRLGEQRLQGLSCRSLSRVRALALLGGLRRWLVHVGMGLSTKRS